MATEPIIMGKLGSPYGVLGWIKVISFTDSPQSLLAHCVWYIKRSHRWEQIVVEKGRPHNKFLVVKLQGCDTPEDARFYTNCLVGISREDFPPLKAGEYYWTDLLGLEVVNLNGKSYGRILSFIETGANDVLVVGKRISVDNTLIPYLSSVVCEVDLNKRKIIVDWEE